MDRRKEIEEKKKRLEELRQKKEQKQALAGKLASSSSTAATAISTVTSSNNPSYNFDSVEQLLAELNIPAHVGKAQSLQPGGGGDGSGGGGGGFNIPMTNQHQAGATNGAITNGDADLLNGGALNSSSNETSLAEALSKAKSYSIVAQDCVDICPETNIRYSKGVQYESLKASVIRLVGQNTNAIIEVNTAADDLICSEIEAVEDDELHQLCSSHASPEIFSSMYEDPINSSEFKSFVLRAGNLIESQIVRSAIVNSVAAAAASSSIAAAAAAVDHAGDDGDVTAHTHAASSTEAGLSTENDQYSYAGSTNQRRTTTTNSINSRHFKEKFIQIPSKESGVSMTACRHLFFYLPNKCNFRPVLDLDWSPVHPEQLLATYGQPIVDELTNKLPLTNDQERCDGQAMIWNVLNASSDPLMPPNRPMTILEANRSITCAKFGGAAASNSITNSSLVFGGLSNGSVCVWDLRGNRRQPVLTNKALKIGRIDNVHMNRVISLTTNQSVPTNSMAVDGHANSVAASAYSFYSVCEDGKICQWDLANMLRPISSMQMVHKRGASAAATVAGSDPSIGNLTSFDWIINDSVDVFVAGRNNGELYIGRGLEAHSAANQNFQSFSDTHFIHCNILKEPSSSPTLMNSPKAMINSVRIHPKMNSHSQMVLMNSNAFSSNLQLWNIRSDSISSALSSGSSSSTISIPTATTTASSTTKTAAFAAGFNGQPSICSTSHHLPTGQLCDVDWHPLHPTVFATGGDSGTLDIWHLNSPSGDERAAQSCRPFQFLNPSWKSTKMEGIAWKDHASLCKLRFHQSGKALAVGSLKGEIGILRLLKLKDEITNDSH